MTRPCSRHVIALAALLVATATLPSVTGLSPLPDLTVTSLDVKATADPDPWAPRDVTLVVKNAGIADSPRAVVELALIHPDGWREVLVGFGAPALEPGEAVTLRSTWTPDRKVGDFELAATVDPTDRVTESDAFNNVRHTRAGAVAPTGLVHPARDADDVPPMGPPRLGDEWTRLAFDWHDTGNPGPHHVLDRSGHGRNAWILRGHPLVSTGLWDTGARFDGSTVLSAPAPDGDALTVSLWVRVDALPTTEAALWSTDGTGCNRTTLTLTPEGAFRLTTFAAVERGCTRSTTTDVHVDPGAWTHVTVTKSTAAATLYVDGAPAGTHAVTPAGSFSGSRLSVGAHPPVAGTPLRSPLTDASLDEFRVYARALTPAEVQVLATPPVTP